MSPIDQIVELQVRVGALERRLEAAEIRYLAQVESLTLELKLHAKRLSIQDAAPELYKALNTVLHAKIIYVGGGPEESIASCGMGSVEPIRQIIMAALEKANGQWMGA